MPDTQAADRGLEPQTALMRVASGMSRTIDPRRPRRLTAAQQAEVRQHPEVKLLYRRLRSLRKMFPKRSIASAKGTPLYKEYQRSYQAYRNMKRRRARYKVEQPVIDIQRQLRGLPLAEEKKTKAEDYILVERVRVIDTLFTFATTSPEEERQRRAAAINALTALCREQEGRGFRCWNDSSGLQQERDEIQQTVLQARSLSDSLSIECKTTQCIFCLGDEGLPSVKRIWEFSDHGGLKRHFHRKHLRHHPDHQPIACPHPRCKATLTGKMYLRNHAEVVHKPHVITLGVRTVVAVINVSSGR